MRGRIVKRNVVVGFAAFAAFALLVTACGGGDDGSAGQQATTEERTTTEDAATTTAPAGASKPSEDCKRVPADLVAAIEEASP